MVSPGLTDVEGIRVGVASDLNALTGVTVVLIENGARAAVEVRGSAPGTRETDLLRPGQLVDQVQAILLCGGSAFGLDAACGVSQFLEEEGFGFPVGHIKVPIVPAAVLFDLFIGDESVRPDAAMGYRACREASNGQVAEGSIGAGCGATVGKIRGMDYAVKSGQASVAIKIGDLIVSALVVVNAFGDIYDRQKKLLAGPRNPETGAMEQTSDLLYTLAEGNYSGNTTLGVVATNASFDKAALNKICQLAHNGLARSIWPAHTMWDGDTIFALSSGIVEADVSLVGLMAADAVAEAVERAALTATSMGDIPSIHDIS
ncbi:MAG: P1 family peptidase [Bacillota bacterium]